MKLIGSIIFVLFFVFINAESTPDDEIKKRGKIYTKTDLPKVALVLSGGAARGLAHIGVISVLEEYNIPLDIIVGVSMGSIVGGYYAYGYTADEMLSKAKDFSILSLIDLKNPKSIILSGEKEENIFKSDIDNIDIENLKIPVIILSTNIETGEIFIFDEGPLSTAMRASSAIPGVFDPVYYKGHTLIDGGILDDFPIDVAKNMGADIVIASNVSVLELMDNDSIAKRVYDTAFQFVTKNEEKFFYKKYIPDDTTLTVLYKTFLLIEKNQKFNIDKNSPDVDFIIEPVDREIKPFDFYKADEGYELGRKATLEIIQDIVQKVKN
jgi:NTE family protein